MKTLMMISLMIVSASAHAMDAKDREATAMLAGMAGCPAGMIAAHIVTVSTDFRVQPPKSLACLAGLVAAGEGTDLALQHFAPAETPSEEALAAPADSDE